ncbi:MAG: hypothetical protein RL172_823 [Bacteroidota bacterium]
MLPGDIISSGFFIPYKLYINKNQTAGCIKLVKAKTWQVMAR